MIQSNARQEQLNRFIKFLRKQRVLYRTLKALYRTSIFQALRETMLLLRYGRKKSLTLILIWRRLRERSHISFIGKSSRVLLFCGCRRVSGVLHYNRGQGHGKKQGLVYAIEMDEDNVKQLQASVNLNGLKNVRIFHLAAGDREAKVEYYYRGSPINVLKDDLADDKSLIKKSIQMLPLDELAKRNGIDPQIIKIDVEGAEYLVLCGMQQLLHKGRLKIYCQIHLTQQRGGIWGFGHTKEDIVRLMVKNGFQLKQLSVRPNSRVGESFIRTSDDIRQDIMLYAFK